MRTRMGFFVAAVLAASNGGCVETYYSAGYQGADGYMYLMGIDVIPTVGRSPFIRQCGPPGAGTMVCRRLQVKDGSPSPSALESHPSAPSIRTWEARPSPLTFEYARLRTARQQGRARCFE
jgi:hypothetical protein